MAFVAPTAGSYILGALVIVAGIIVPLTVMVSRLKLDAMTRQALLYSHILIVLFALYKQIIKNKKIFARQE